MVDWRNTRNRLGVLTRAGLLVKSLYSITELVKITITSGP